MLTCEEILSTIWQDAQAYLKRYTQKCVIEDARVKERLHTQHMKQANGKILMLT